MTGACGINCSICKLKLLGTCSGCGAGKSISAKRKLEAQKRLFGNTCAILSCAVLNNVDYCMRDCNMFPCTNFHAGYPFSESFLAMQKRRRELLPVALSPTGEPITVPDEYWETLKNKDVLTVCNMAMVETEDGKGSYIFDHLNKRIAVNAGERTINLLSDNNFITVDDPLLTLLSVLYLITIDKFRLFRKELTTFERLKENISYRSTFTTNIESVRERFENDLNGFSESSLNLGGVKVNMADMAFRFTPFPRTPVYYLLWKKNDEFDGRVSVLFERSIENYFTPSAIWALVNLLNRELITGSSEIFF